MAVRRTPLVELGWRIHRALYRASGGRIGARVGPLPVLLLTVRGRRSGEPRTVALNYLQDGRRLVVFASHAGEHRHPPWLLKPATLARGRGANRSEDVASERPRGRRR